MDKIMPIIEILIIFGLQYASAHVGTGTIKALNAFRCMSNSLVSTTWAYGAGTWQFIMYINEAENAKPGLNEAYGYLCTCLIDFNGFKDAFLSSIDTTNTKNAFSSCSEHAMYEAILARQAADSTAASRTSAAE
jgi:hypothetical protein